MKLQEKTEFWLKKLNDLEGVIHGVPADSAWESSALACEALDKVRASFASDIKTLAQDAMFIFNNQNEGEDASEQSAALLKKWYIAGAPSLTALCVFALEHFEITAPQDFIQAVLIASVLGEIENDLTYHNNMHYRKVAFHMLRLITVHNAIYNGTDRSFNAEKICLLLMGACAHDLGHDGLGNTVKGVFMQGRLEKLSYDLALPYFKAVGFADEKVLADFRVMILCTEVTPLDDPTNIMNQMKAAYRFHYQGDKTKTHTLNLDSEIAALEVDANLTMMCLILHEADIASSAGVTYEVTKFETSIYMKEIGTKHARPQHVIDFLDQICKRQFLSDAGQRLYAANLARIYALAQADVAAGDELYPEPEHADFLLHFAQEGQGTTTIN